MNYQLGNQFDACGDHEFADLYDSCMIAVMKHQGKRNAQRISPNILELKNSDEYVLMGLNRAATEQDVKRAYYKIAKAFHPDLAENKDDATEILKLINPAYEILMSPREQEKRAIARKQYPEEIERQPYKHERFLDKFESSPDQEVPYETPKHENQRPSYDDQDVFVNMNRNRNRHLSDEDFVNLINGKLNQSDKVRVKRHLETCDACYKQFMICRKHLTIKDIHELLDDIIPTNTKYILEQHMKWCSACKQRLNSYKIHLHLGDIENLVNNTLSPEDRDRVMKHMQMCQPCKDGYQQYKRNQRNDGNHWDRAKNFYDKNKDAWGKTKDWFNGAK